MFGLVKTDEGRGEQCLGCLLCKIALEQSRNEYLYQWPYVVHGGEAPGKLEGKKIFSRKK